MVCKPMDPPSERPASRLTYLVKQVELAIRQELDHAVRPFGLTTPQYTVLSVLVDHPGLSSAELARRSFVSPQAANQMVVALERKGLVVRTSESNQRVLELRLSERGRAVLAGCTELVGDIETRMLARMNPSDRDTTRRLLVRCLIALREERTAGCVSDGPAKVSNRPPPASPPTPRRTSPGWEAS